MKKVLIGLLVVILLLVTTIITVPIIFKDDIEKKKLFTVENEVNKILPQRTDEINSQIKIINW